MTNRQTLVLGGNYEVVQEASTIVFYLNTTTPTTPSSPAVPPNPTGQVPVAALLGIAAAGAASVPIALWWRQIRALPEGRGEAGDAMRRATQVLALAGLAFLLCSSFALAVVPSVRASSTPNAPALVHAFPEAAAAASATVHPAAPSASPTVAASASSAHPNGQVCQTPGGAPNWQSSNFFTDAAVTFWTPGNPSLSGQNFLVVPCNNNIPTYTNGFWMNVTTNVELTVATVTIWGTGWPTATDAQPDLKGFSPATPAVFAMNIAPPFYRTASFYFNDYRYFWPGSQVYFNISLSTTQASPGTIYSANPLTQYDEPIQWSGGVNNATWGFYVASPFAPSPPGFAPVNFSNIIGVTTTPTVLGTPSFEPNPKQTVQVTLTALNVSGGPAIPIPEAQGTFTLTGAVTGVYFADFGPANHTTLTLSQPLGPYPGTLVQFNMTCWLPWEGGALDRIYSPTYTFNWSPNGSWWDPTGGLTGADNLNLTSSPDVTAGGSTTVLATGTSVNITIHEPIENVTIGSAAVHFRYVDTNGVTYGTIPMVASNWNTSYAVLPGLPSGAGVTFSVVAKDIYGDPLSSGNYSVHGVGSSGEPAPRRLRSLLLRGDRRGDREPGPEPQLHRRQRHLVRVGARLRLRVREPGARERGRLPGRRVRNVHRHRPRLRPDADLDGDRGDADSVHDRLLPDQRPRLADVLLLRPRADRRPRHRDRRRRRGVGPDLQLVPRAPPEGRGRTAPDLTVNNEE